MWNGRTGSVVLGTYAERASIREVVNGFFATGVVDEVLVVNNNAEPGTKEEVDKTKARQVFEPKQGYGHAYQRGLAEATGDLLVLAEPDGTFLPGDIVTWDLGGGIDHVGIVTNTWYKPSQRYLIVHNIGSGTRLEDVLFAWKITGHYRYF